MNEQTQGLVNRFARIVLKAQAEHIASCEAATELAQACKEVLVFRDGSELKLD